MTHDELKALADALVGYENISVTHVVVSVETDGGISTHELHSNGDRNKPFFIDCATVPDENAPSFSTITEALNSL